MVKKIGVVKKEAEVIHKKYLTKKTKTNRNLALNLSFLIAKETTHVYSFTEGVGVRVREKQHNC